MKLSIVSLHTEGLHSPQPRSAGMYTMSPFVALSAEIIKLGALSTTHDVLQGWNFELCQNVLMSTALRRWPGCRCTNAVSSRASPRRTSDAAFVVTSPSGMNTMLPFVSNLKLGALPMINLVLQGGWYAEFFQKVCMSAAAMRWPGCFCTNSVSSCARITSCSDDGFVIPCFVVGGGSGARGGMKGGER